jgi:hypothetical protein
MKTDNTKSGINPPEPTIKPDKNDDNEKVQESPGKIKEPATPGPKVDEPPQPQQRTGH